MKECHFFFSLNRQTNSVTHRFSYLSSTKGSFRGGEGEVKMPKREADRSHHLLPKLRMSAAITPISSTASLRAEEHIQL
jgi:hypothetical protein